MILYCDLETTGLDRKNDRIIIGGFKVDDQEIWTEYPTFSQKVREILANPDVVKVGHNFLFDCAFLEKAGYTVRGEIRDTRVLAFGKWPYDKLKLKHLGKTILGQEVLELKSLKGRGKKVEDISKPILEGYCKQDVQLTFDLYQLLYPTRSHWIDTVEFGLTGILKQIEERGIYLDADKLGSLHTLWSGEVKDITGRHTINLNSHQQVLSHLQERGFNGKATDKVSLKSATSGVSICKEILRYRELSTLVGRYSGPFLKTHNRGYLHGEFNQAGQEKNDRAVKTGRLSSSNPNLQNIPARSANGKLFRKCFTAPPGFKLIVADAGQIEPRFVAHFTQDQTLIDIFTSGIDFHGVVTEAAFGRKTYTSDERFVGKTLGLATMYLAQEYRLMMELRKYDVFLPLAEVKRRQDGIKRKFGSVIEWGKRYTAQAEHKGYFTTYGGRRYPYSKDIAVFNNMIQSSQADYIKLCCAGIEELGHKIVNVIHDEVLVYTKEPERAVEDINRVMSTAISLGDIPVIADVRIVESWGEK